METGVSTLWNTAGWPLALGIVTNTFSGHLIVPSIYSSMERPQDFEQMIDLSFLTVLGCCLVMAVGGYHMFGSLVEDHITILLQNFSSAEAAMDCLT
jgi:vesicular inhibitory amino acid transporter